MRTKKKEKGKRKRKGGNKQEPIARKEERKLLRALCVARTWCVLLRHAMLHFAQREEPVYEHKGRRPKGLISQPRTPVVNHPVSDTRVIAGSLPLLCALCFDPAVIDMHRVVTNRAFL